MTYEIYNRALSDATTGVGWAAAEPNPYEAMCRLAGVHYIEYEPRTNVTRCDAALLRRLGLDAGRPLNGEEWGQRVHPRDRERIGRHARSVIDGAPATPHEVVRLRAANGWRWFRVEQSMRAADESRLVAVLTDITIEMRRRVSMRRSAKMYRAVWKSLPGMAAVLDRFGRIVDANTAWLEAARLRGGPQDAFAGESYLAVTQRAAMAGDTVAAQSLEGILRVLHHREKRFTLAYDSPVPGGETRWFRMTVLRLRQPARGALVVHTDISPPRANDLALKPDRDHLAHVQRLGTMNALATSIAHELNQPLETIVASASAGRRRLDAGDVEELHPILEDILEAAMRAAKVMRTARAMMRRQSHDRARVDLNEIVGTVVRFVASDLLIHQVTTSVSLVPDCPTIVGDRVQLQQVILNLLLNAIDAVAERPIGERCISVTTTLPERGQVVLVVSDTGRGVAPEVAGRLFDPFVTTKQDGTGLGLTIVRSVVEAHGGRVVLESPSEHSAVFRVTLPYDVAEETDRDQPLPGVSARSTSRHRR